ncbi:MAG: tetratricopeptide repeat protein [Phycisphaerae bacterium]|jgi:TolA-binding protein
MTQAGAHTRTFAVLVLLVLAAVTQVAPADDTDAEADRAYLSANGLLNRGLYDLAAEEYRAFLSVHKRHEKVRLARYGLAVCCFRAEKFDEAAAELEQLTRDKDFAYDAEVWTMLGQCRLARSEYGLAVEALLHVVRTHPEHALADDAAAVCAQALFSSGHYAETVEWCAAFAKQWPDNPLAERVDYFGALAEMQQGAYAAAAERLERVLKRFPAGPFAHHAGILIAQCHQHSNAPAKATEWFRRVLDDRESGYEAEALMGLATLAYHGGKGEEAAGYLDRLLKEHGDGSLAASAKLLRGCLYFEAEDYGRARKLFQEVARADDDLADDAAYWIAKCQLRQGETSEAAKRLEKAIAEYPKSDLRAEMAYDRLVALVRLEDDAAAAEAAEAFGHDFPGHDLEPDALYLAALVAHRTKQYDPCREHCRRFQRKYAENALAADVAFLVAENEYAAGEYAAAVAAGGRFRKTYPDDSRQAQATYRLGMSLYRLDRGDEALKMLAGLSTDDLARPELRPALLALGDLRFQAGDWGEAEKCLTQYLGDDLTVAAAEDALLQLGLAQQRQGRHDDALTVFDKLLAHFSKGPQRLQAMFERGQALVALDRLDEAREAFTQVLAQDGASRFVVFAHNHLGAIAVRQQRPQDAADEFAKVLDSSPDETLAAEARYQRGQALLLLERYAEAEKVLREFLDRYGDHEHAREARAQVCVAQARQDHCDQALESIRGLEREGLGKLSASLQSAVRYEKAWCLRQLGKTDEAQEAYRALVEAPGELHVHAALELAEIKAAAGHHEQAGQLLQRVRAGTDVPPAVQERATYRLGVCEFELGHDTEAIKLLEGFLEAYPDSSLVASASFFCGEASFRAGQHEKAVTHLTRIAERFAGDAVHGPALLRLGEALAVLQRWARSEKVFADYLERYADSENWFQAQFGLAWARENQDRHDEAIAAYRVVVDRHQGPTAARAQFQIGECLFAKKDLEAATRELLKVDILYAYPQWSAAALYEAGRCFEAQGKAVEAREQFKAVVDKYEQSRWAELSRERLRKLGGGALPGRDE